EGTVCNRGTTPAPFSLGYHPYFVCDRERTTLHIPAEAEWPMDREGRAASLPEASRLSEAIRDGVQATAVEGNLHFLQVTDFDAGRREAYGCRLDDDGIGRRVHFQTSGLFSLLVLFIPSWGEAVSLEPHSCIPDACHLPWEASKTGLLELAPEEERTFSWRIDVEHNSNPRWEDHP